MDIFLLSVALRLQVFIACLRRIGLDGADLALRCPLLVIEASLKAPNLPLELLDGLQIPLLLVVDHALQVRELEICRANGRAISALSRRHPLLLTIRWSFCFAQDLPYFFRHAEEFHELLDGPVDLPGQVFTLLAIKTGLLIAIDASIVDQGRFYLRSIHFGQSLRILNVWIKIQE